MESRKDVRQVQKIYSNTYERVKLPVLYTKAVGEKKDTILLHGGNDSYME